jgi:regulator of sirC expression with transglutaminase-like and TPR domain
MSLPTPSISTQKLSEGERAALLTLLSDEDQDVYQTVRTRIISCGPEAREWMRPLVLSGDPLLRRRSQEIVRYFARQDADTSFLSFCVKHGEDFDLEESVWLLAQTAYPDINVDAYSALLDDYATTLRDRLDGEVEGEEILGTVSRYLFEDLKFAGNEIAYYDPQNSYLNRVLDRRTGNPISLSVLYILIARRLKLPIAGVGLPGHFICRYQSASEEIYLDAFNRGKTMDKADCVQFLSHLHPEAREDYLLPSTPRRILTRICNNLHQIYRRQGLKDDATRMQRYLVALSR